MKGTLTSKQRISWLFENGKKFSSASFLAFCGKADTPIKSNDRRPHSPQDNVSCGRIAFIAGKKLGKAPLRSKAKRRMREAVRVSGFSCGRYDVVLVARKGSLQKDFAVLIRDVERLARFIQEDEETSGNVLQNVDHDVQERKELYKESLEEEDSKEPSSGKEKQKKSLIHRLIKAIISIPRTLALLCIKLYRHAISPLLPPSCRYVPTCSEYALIAFERFGFWKGLWLSVKRVGRCHPFAQGGYDPVPDKL